MIDMATGVRLTPLVAVPHASGGENVVQLVPRGKASSVPGVADVPANPGKVLAIVTYKLGLHRFPGYVATMYEGGWVSVEDRLARTTTWRAKRPHELAHDGKTWDRDPRVPVGAAFEFSRKIDMARPAASNWLGWLRSPSSVFFSRG